MIKGVNTGSSAIKLRVPSYYGDSYNPYCTCTVPLYYMYEQLYNVDVWICHACPFCVQSLRRFDCTSLFWIITGSVLVSCDPEDINASLWFPNDSYMIFAGLPVGVCSVLILRQAVNAGR